MDLTIHRPPLCSPRTGVLTRFLVDRSTPVLQNMGMASAPILDTRPVGASGLPLTPEQERIISMPPTQTRKWLAFAGCAKTTTSVEYTHAHKLPALYLAFNQSIANDAKGRFPSYVHVQTAHGYAFSQMNVKRYESRHIRYSMKPEHLDPAADMIRPMSRMTDIAMRRAILKALNAFCISSDMQFTAKHMESFPIALRPAALSMVKRVIDRIIAFEDSGMIFNPDVYLKAFQLRGRVEERFRYLILDEAQDLNPVLIAIAKQTGLPCMVVGDPWQCLPPGTMISTPEGRVAIEKIAEGDLVLAGMGRGVTRSARVTKVRSFMADRLVAIGTERGRRILSTLNHVHFAGFEAEASSPGQEDFRNDHLDFTITMCGGDGRHEYVIEGGDAADRQALERHGLSIDDLADGGWRVMAGSDDLGGIHTLYADIAETIPHARLIENAALASGPTLPLTAAGRCLPGMRIFVIDDDGVIVTDTITHVQTMPYDGTVYDIDVEGVHNFIADGVSTHNSIYRFRGAEQAMDHFDGDEFTLSMSFRFGPKVAAVGNFILKQSTNRPDHPIMGNPMKDTRVQAYEGSVKGRATMLARTNMRLFESLVQIPHTFHVVGGVKDMIDLVEAGYHLWCESKGKVARGTKPFNAKMVRFKNWDAVVDSSEHDEEPELIRLVKIMEAYQDKVPEILTSLRERSRDHEDDARFIVSTAHKAKGREWETVVLLDDYFTLSQLRAMRAKKRITSYEYDQEINLLYVAATRAIGTLMISAPLFDEIAAGTGLPRY